MGFFSKLFLRSSATPPWAEYLSEEQYNSFETELRHALEARRLPNDIATLRSGAIPVGLGNAEATLGLGPIARKCLSANRGWWPELINQHLDRALAPADELIAKLASDFEVARQCLKVQLVPQGFVRNDWYEGLNFRPFGAGVVAALVYDLPNAVHTVPAADVRGWGRLSSELFDIAAANVRAESDKPLVERVDFANSRVSVRQLVGESFFVCSHALWLDRNSDSPNDRGILLSVPTRHAVLFHQIRDGSAWRALDRLACDGRRPSRETIWPGQSQSVLVESRRNHRCSRPQRGRQTSGFSARGACRRAVWPDRDRTRGFCLTRDCRTERKHANWTAREAKRGWRRCAAPTSTCRTSPLARGLTVRPVASVHCKQLPTFSRCSPCRTQSAAILDPSRAAPSLPPLARRRRLKTSSQSRRWTEWLTASGRR